MSSDVSLPELDDLDESFHHAGQPFQDDLEEQLRKEDERQAQEIRELLQAELGDCSDFSLYSSDGDSDEGGGHVTDTGSGHVTDTGSLVAVSGRVPGVQSKQAAEPRSPGDFLVYKPHVQPTGHSHAHSKGLVSKMTEESNFIPVQGEHDPRLPTSESAGPSDLPVQPFGFQHSDQLHINGKLRGVPQMPGQHPGQTVSRARLNQVEDFTQHGWFNTDRFQFSPVSDTTRQEAWLSNERSHVSSMPSLIEAMTGTGTQSSNCSKPAHTNGLVQSAAVYGLSRAGNAPEVKINSRSGSQENLDDEWLMQIKQPLVSPFLRSHSPPQQFEAAGPGAGLRPGLQDLEFRFQGESAQNLNQNATATSATHVLTTTSTSSFHPVQSFATVSSKENNLNHFTTSKMPTQSPPVSDAGDGHLLNYKVTYRRSGQAQAGEEQFYLDDEQVVFFKKDGPEDDRTYEQLQILYGARGREIEDMKQRMEEIEEEKSKEIRSLKHKLAVANGEAEGMSESLRQSQSLLQQARSDDAEAAGKIRALEAELTSFKDSKEELIKKLQSAESTIDNLTQHIEELQASESLSRARNDHEAAIASLTSRYDRELFALKEKLDVSKATSEAKQEELLYLQKQLAEMRQQLEQAQISRAETINRLARSLEDSQRQCQTFLEQSSTHELSMLKFQLQQAVTAKKMSDDLCTSFQTEIKELKEQLTMFQSASSLGVFSLTSRVLGTGSQDDSMIDLGIKKTLNFDSPHLMARRSEGPQSSEELVSSLRCELEKCLLSNKQKRGELADKLQEVKTLREDLRQAQLKIEALENTCSQQKSKLKELDSLTSPSDGAGRIIEARLSRQLEEQGREKEVLLRDIQDYKTRLKEVGDSEAKLAEINSELSQQLAQMVSDFDMDKRAALESCQRTMEEVSQMSLHRLRQEMTERLESEKAMLLENSKHKIRNLEQELSACQSELDQVKAMYVQVCQESAAQERKATETFQRQLADQLDKVKDKLEMDKREWENFKREEMEKELEELKKSLRSVMEAELNMETEAKVTKARETCLEEQRVARDKLLEEVKDTAKKQFEEQRERDLKTWSEERNSYNTKMEVLNAEILELQQKLKQLSGVAQDKLAPVAAHVKDDSEIDIEKVKKQHQRDLERAAKTREENFQAELRYFLKEKDEQCRVKLEQAVKECQVKMRAELEQSVSQARQEQAEKVEALVVGHQEEMKALTDKLKESEARLEQERKLIRGSEEQPSSETSQTYGELQAQVKDLQEQLLQDRQALEIRIHLLQDEHSAEIEKFSLRYREEERKLRQKFEGDLRLLESEHQKTMASLQEELQSQKLDAELVRTSLDIVRKESELDKRIAEQLRAEIEQLHVKCKSAQDASERIQEYREKWFQEARDYINKEIESGVREKVAQERDKMKYELDKLKEWETKKECLEKSLEEKLQQRLALEKAAIGLEKEEEVKKQVGRELESLKKKFRSDLEAGVVKEKTRLEQEVLSWKEAAEKKMKEDINNIVRVLQAEMKRNIETERKKSEGEVRKSKEEEMRQIREELESEMRQRIQKEREDWERASCHGWEERLQLEAEARSKACQERQKALDFIQAREVMFREERERLLAGLKKCRHNLEESKREQEILEEKFRELVSQHKAKTDKAEQNLSKQKMKYKEKKSSLTASFKAQILELQHNFWTQLQEIKRERANLHSEFQKQAELISKLPDSSGDTFVELRDQYLQAVARIKEAITRAETASGQALNAELDKQKSKVVELFKAKCRVTILAVLTGKVADHLISCLLQSLDHLSQQLLSQSTTPLPAGPDDLVTRFFPPSSDLKTDLSSTRSLSQHKTKSWSGDPDDVVKKDSSGVTGKTKSGSREMLHGEDIEPSRGEPDVRQGQQQQSLKQTESKPSPHNSRSHPQLEKVDLFDSDTLPHTPSSSNNSSPGSRRVKQHVSMPEIPSVSGDHKLADSLDSVRCVPDSLSYGEVSQRKDRKVLQAHILLAQWATSGETPWKATHGNTKSLDADGFVKPGQEAEKWLRMQKESSHGPRPAPSLKILPSSYSSDSSPSSETEMSFLTLEPQHPECYNDTPRSTTNHNTQKYEYRSQESVSSADSDQSVAAEVSSNHFCPVPTSTPLTKVGKNAVQSRAVSEGDSNQPWEWKNVKGELLKRQTDEQWSQATRGSHPAGLSSPHRSRPSSNNMVIKSAEFPSHVSRISADSGSQLADLWRYKSLEDLISAPQREMRTYQNHGQDAAMKGAGSGCGQREESSSLAGYCKPPVMAMNSDFWRQQEDQDSLSDVEYLPFDRISGVAKNEVKLVNGNFGELKVSGVHRPDKQVSAGEHRTRTVRNSKSSDGQGSQAPISKRGVDTSSKQPGSKSDPGPTKWLTELSLGSQDEHSHHQKAYSGYRRVGHHTSNHATPTNHVAFQEDRKDLVKGRQVGSSQCTRPVSPHKKTKGRLTRSTSDQSLNIAHTPEDLLQGHRQDRIDSLVSTYTSAAPSYFDLLHFPQDEQF